MKNGETGVKNQDFIQMFENDKLISLEEDQEWYVLSTKWYKHLVSSIKNKKRISEINNSDILQDGYNLKDNLIEDKDFLLVSPKTWNALTNKFNGGPAILRKVIKEGENGKFKRIEIYPYQIFILKSKDGKIIQASEKKITISKTKTVKDLSAQGCQTLNVEKAKLWNYFSPSSPTSLEGFEDKTIEESLIQDRQKILFETPSVDGTYTLTFSEKKSNYSLENITKFLKRFDSFSKLSKTKGTGLCGLSNLGKTLFIKI